MVHHIAADTTAWRLIFLNSRQVSVHLSRLRCSAGAVGGLTIYVVARCPVETTYFVCLDFSENQGIGRWLTCSFSSSMNSNPIIIIIHLLGLAPAGYLAAPDNGA
jgi:hypothetical protein